MLAIVKFCGDFVAVEGLADMGPDKLLICVVPCIVHLEDLAPEIRLGINFTYGRGSDYKLDFDPTGKLGLAGFRIAQWGQWCFRVLHVVFVVERFEEVRPGR